MHSSTSLHNLPTTPTPPIETPQIPPNNSPSVASRRQARQTISTDQFAIVGAIETLLGSSPDAKSANDDPRRRLSGSRLLRKTTSRRVKPQKSLPPLPAPTSSASTLSQSTPVPSTSSSSASPLSVSSSSFSAPSLGSSSFLDNPPSENDFVAAFFSSSATEQEKQLRSLYARVLSSAKPTRLSPTITEEEPAVPRVSISARLQSVLDDPQQYQSYKLSLIKMSADENLEFFEAVREYRRKHLYAHQHCVEVACDIFNRFIRSNATTPVNLDGSVVRQITESIERKEFSAVLFDQALNCVALLLGEDCMRKHDQAMVEMCAKAQEIRSEIKLLRPSQKRSFAEFLGATSTSLEASFKLYTIVSDILAASEDDVPRIARKLVQKIQEDEFGARLILPKTLSSAIIQASEKGCFSRRIFEPTELYLGARILYPEFQKFKQIQASAKPRGNSSLPRPAPEATIGLFGLPLRKGLPSGAMTARPAL